MMHQWCRIFGLVCWLLCAQRSDRWLTKCETFAATRFIDE